MRNRFRQGGQGPSEASSSKDHRHGLPRLSPLETSSGVVPSSGEEPTTTAGKPHVGKPEFPYSYSVAEVAELLGEHVLRWKPFVIRKVSPLWPTSRCTRSPARF